MQELETLDLAVREQFDELWQRLHETPMEAGRRAELAAAWGALGQWYHVYKYDLSAVGCYENARLLDPEEPRWPYYLGLLAQNQSDLDAAAELFSLAAALAPDEMAPRVCVADLALLQQDVENAEALYSEILAASPGDPGALYGISQVQLLQGNYTAALELLEELAERQPDAVQVRYALAMAWRQLGNEERSAEQLTLVPDDNFQQIPLMLDDPWEQELRRCNRGGRYYCRQGVAASRRGDPLLAADLFGRAVRANPVNPENRLNYGISLREIGHWQAAAEQLEEALRLSVEGSEVRAKIHTQLGLLRIDRGRPQAAISHLEAALAIDSRSVPAHLALGRLHHFHGHLEEALSHYAAVREIDRAYPENRFWHDALLIVLDRQTSALQALEEDLRVVGDDDKLRLLLARLLSTANQASLRDVARARLLLEAADLPRDVFFAETAAMVAAEEGRFDDAIAWQGAAVAVLADQPPRGAEHRARRRLTLYREARPCRLGWEERERPLSTNVRAP